MTDAHDHRESQAVAHALRAALPSPSRTAMNGSLPASGGTLSTGS
ncbi:hypothetical protein OG215_37885 (plasmid) [Streptomyces globisporus]|nr:hypothetical protein OG215_37885 [Streptomyces globisporus]